MNKPTSQEEVWFDCNWNHEKTTTLVAIISKTMSRKASYHIAKTVKSYLDSIGFASTEAISLENSAFVVDLVNKTYSLTSDWNARRFKVPLAYPSQIPDFLGDNVGRLTGAYFGL